MEKRLYTGVYTIEKAGQKNKYFALADAWADKPGFDTTVRISFSKSNVITKIDEDLISFSLTNEEAQALALQLLKTVNAIELLKGLDKRNKLNDNAYLEKDM